MLPFASGSLRALRSFGSVARARARARAGALALAVPCVLVACGGGVTPDRSPSSGPATQDTGGPSGCGATPCNADGTVSGSFELAFTNVARTDGRTSYGVVLGDTRASITNRARLDVGVPRADGTVDVLVTGRWNAIGRFVGKVTKDTLTLAGGKASFGGGDTAAQNNESNTWTELTFPIGPNGELAGTFEAKGELFASAGDVVEQAPIAGSGTLAPDRRAPEIQLAPPRKSRAGVRLPWDPIWIKLAEPLRRDALSTMIAALPEVGWPPVGDASAKPDDAIDGLYGVATTFSNSGATRTLVAPSGITDPSQNPLAPFTAEIAFRDVGAARARHELDAGFASWGSVVLANDARCEAGACAVFPAEDQTRCDTPSGIAGRLASATSGPLTKVHARVRVLAADSPYNADKPYVIEPIRFEVVSNGQIGLAQIPVELTRNGASDLPWTTPWTTVDVDVSGTEAGFSFVRSSCDSTGGLPLPQATVSVVVDAVWAD
jgi:hypothetical protein